MSRTLTLFPAPTAVRVGEGAFTLPAGADTWAREALAMTPAPGWLSETLTAGWCGADEREAQGYRLRITRDGVRTQSPSRTGLRHARATLRQVIAQNPGVLPVAEIEDRPVFKTRGVMLDVSRCRIPTTEELLRIVDQLAGLKCNHLQLYTEHTFAYAGAEDVWRDWDPFTPDDIRRVDQHARDRGVELAANQNCFGHLRHWLENPKFAHLAETHGDWMFDVWPRSGPFSLCPTDPASERFVANLLAQLLPNFTSRLVNIGCDETYDIAYGRSADEVRRRGRGVVFAEFVAKITAIARSHDRRSMFWADIALSHPECLDLLPDDIIALAWGYEPDAPWDRWCDACRGAGREVWLCPGTSSWRSLTGRTTERRANLESAAAAGVRHHAEGFLVCDWGDSGHWQTWPLALHAIADGLDVGWRGSGESTRGDSALRAASAVVHEDRTGEVSPWLERLGDADLSLREVSLPLSRPGVPGRLRNQTAIFADLFQPWGTSLQVGGIDAWDACRSTMQTLRHQRPVLGSVMENAEAELMIDLALHAAERAAVRRGLTGPSAASLQREWKRLEQRHRELWIARSRPGGLEQSIEFFRKVDHAAGERGDP